MMCGHLGRVIEHVPGLRYSEYVRQEIVARCGLGENYSSLSDIPEARRADIAKGHAWGVQLPDVDIKGLAPGDGGLATPDAWAGFIHRLAIGKILSAHTTAEMFKVHARHNYNGECGLGVFCQTVEGKRLWGPDGSGPGYRSQALHDFDSGTTFSIMKSASDYCPRSALPEAIKVQVDPSRARNLADFDNSEILVRYLSFVQQIIPASVILPSDDRTSLVDNEPLPTHSFRHPASPRIAQIARAQR